MPLESLFELQGTCLPNVNGLVLGGSRDQFVIGCDSNRVDVLLMRHDRHLCGVDHLVGLGGGLNGIPHLQSVILADRCEKLVLLRCETDTRDVLVMSKEGRQASDLLLERLRGIKSPHLDRVVLGAREEDGLFFAVLITLVNHVEAQDDVGVARI